MHTSSLQSPEKGAPTNTPPFLDQEPTNRFDKPGSNNHSGRSAVWASKPSNLKIKTPANPAQLKQTTEKAVEGTLIGDAIQEVERLERDEAIHRVAALLKEEKSVSLKLGGVLARILREKWHEPEFTSFRDFVEAKYGMSYRKAKYLIDIYEALIRSRVDDEKFGCLSWCKWREIAGVITPENVDEWIAIAREKTVVQLREAVQAPKQDGGPKAITQQSAKPTRARFLKFYEDQNAIVETAITNAKEVTGTQDDEAALEYIFRDFAEDVHAARIEDRIIKLGFEASLKLIRKCFPDADISASVPEETTA